VFSSTEKLIQLIDHELITTPFLRVWHLLLRTLLKLQVRGIFDGDIPRSEARQLQCWQRGDFFYLDAIRVVREMAKYWGGGSL